MTENNLTRYEMVKIITNDIYIVKYHELEIQIITKHYQIMIQAQQQHNIKFSQRKIIQKWTFKNNYKPYNDKHNSRHKT